MDRVAIVGGGAAGSFLALELAARGIGSILFDRHAAFARGVAYGATAPWHRLNVPIDKMGRPAAGETAGFQDWYAARHGPLPADFTRRFVPRSAYGDWLAERLDAAVASGRVARTPLEVVALAPDAGGVALTTADGARHRAALAALCLGHAPPRPPLALPAARVIGDIWRPGALAPVVGDDAVLVLGTGSTAIDAVLELTGRGHRGPITMLSRRGLLPLVDQPQQTYRLRRDPLAPPVTARRLLRLLRDEVAEAAAAGVPWPSVLDAFRLLATPIWQALPDAERGRFARHLRARWLVHRHRLAPDIAATLRDLRAAGLLTIRRGRLATVTPIAEGGLAVALHPADGGPDRLRVGWLVTCTGPDEDIRRRAEPLVRQLLADGLLRPPAAGFGIDVDRDGRAVGADGRASDRLLVLGTATRAQFGEVTSAPQIRDRAAALAGVIAARLAAPVTPP